MVICEAGRKRENGSRIARIRLLTVLLLSSRAVFVYTFFLYLLFIFFIKTFCLYFLLKIYLLFLCRHIEINRIMFIGERKQAESHFNLKMIRIILSLVRIKV